MVAIKRRNRNQCCGVNMNPTTIAIGSGVVFLLVIFLALLWQVLQTSMALTATPSSSTEDEHSLLQSSSSSSSSSSKKQTKKKPPKPTPTPTTQAPTPAPTIAPPRILIFNAKPPLPSVAHLFGQEEEEEEDKTSTTATTKAPQHVLGVGNLMQGLLAAHLLAKEFDRTLCLRHWPEFDEYFEYTEEYAAAVQKDCVGLTQLLQQQENDDKQKDDSKQDQQQKPREKITTITIWKQNVAKLDECQLQHLLASTQLQHSNIVMHGNAYPRWNIQRTSITPTTNNNNNGIRGAAALQHNMDGIAPPMEIPPNFFFQFYRPKPPLLQVLPFQMPKELGGSSEEQQQPEESSTDRPPPPAIVVHLRAPDPPPVVANNNNNTTAAASASQQQQQQLLLQQVHMDENTLFYLGQQLEGKAYLVTNEPNYYHKFRHCCDWDFNNSPNTKMALGNYETTPVRHSADPQRIVWKPLAGKDNPHMTKDAEQQQQQPDETEVDEDFLWKRLWVDWMTLLMAQKVYHSPNSEFAKSALHWNTQRVTTEAGTATTTTQAQDGFSIQGMTSITTGTGRVLDALDLQPTEFADHVQIAHLGLDAALRKGRNPDEPPSLANRLPPWKASRLGTDGWERLAFQYLQNCAMQDHHQER